MSTVSAQVIPLPGRVPWHPEKFHVPSAAAVPLEIWAYPTRLLLALKYVWYMVTLVVLVAFWSMPEKPPSPKSARFQETPSGISNGVPLSWVPPIVKLGSVGCTAKLSNCVALKPAVLRLVHVAPPSAERKIPPSLPS